MFIADFGTVLLYNIGANTIEDVSKYDFCILTDVAGTQVVSILKCRIIRIHLMIRIHYKNSRWYSTVQ